MSIFVVTIGLFYCPSKDQIFNFILIIAIESYTVDNLILEMGNLTLGGQNVTPVCYCYKSSFYDFLPYLIMFHLDSIFEYSLKMSLTKRNSICVKTLELILQKYAFQVTLQIDPFLVNLYMLHVSILGMRTMKYLD